ncbi:hypothetical protein K461DRAFT_309490 [Myriangium duriaei CBS 260.36]|uniref:Mid2 domain-containing protein n=1 Tax=Myriangium duriaei CBS 260.36 TaxID=1168546 RepID=A0A9P4MJP7_9PEZI|nr:hypothetical protein K461DRAFT_309490 [Myriangium duriaei CBS 260.36]
MEFLSSLLASGLLLLALPSVKSVCYKPDRTSQATDFNPCYAFHSDNSFCCATRKTWSLGKPELHDNCLPNGLCQWIYNGTYSYWREGCSNSSWPSEWCLTGVCGNGDEVDANGNAALTPCDNTSTSLTWCCGRNNTACCGKGAPDEVSLSRTIAAYATLSSTSSTKSVAGSTTTTLPLSSSTESVLSSTTAPTGPSNTSTTHPKSGVGLSSGAKAGIGIGVAFGVLLLLVALIAMGIILKRKRAQTYPQYADSSYQAADLSGKHMTSPTSPSRAHDIASPFSDGQRVELDASNRPIELQGQERHRPKPLNGDAGSGPALTEPGRGSQEVNSETVATTKT